MASSQNGWPALPAGSRLLHQWQIPAKNGLIKVTLRNGAAGFVLAHYTMWYSEVIEDVTDSKTLDDWGWAYRAIRGSESDLSNHASGTAVDLNALKHPLGVKGTLSPSELEKIGRKLKQYKGCIRAGAFYNGRVDEMHAEIDKPLAYVETVARQLLTTPRGKKLINANRGQTKVIWS